MNTDWLKSMISYQHDARIARCNIKNWRVPRRNAIYVAAAVATITQESTLKVYNEMETGKCLMLGVPFKLIDDHKAN